jgi:tRNA 2-thiocytidine biosynthesis protein TtcA
MLSDKDRVLVGVSGGADSLCLLSLLCEYSRKHGKDWDIRAVHVAPDFPGWRITPLERLFRRLGVNHEILPITVPAQSRNTCYLCARLRRARLFGYAREAGFSRLALAHHIEDVNETFLMTLLYNASASAFLPSQPLFGGKLEVIRPLYRFDKATIRRYNTSHGLKVIRNRCPQAETGKRLVVRRFLDRLARLEPRIHANIFAGIRNVKRDYLP